MHFIKTNGLNVTVGDRTLIHQLTIVLRGRIGLTGQNGAGKSTLLRTLARDPSVFRSGKVLLHAPSGRVADVLGAAEILDALERTAAGTGTPRDFEITEGRWDLRQRAQTALERSGLEGVELSRDVRTLSGGEAARLISASLYLSDAQILLLDEPTNHMDQNGRRAFYRFLENYDGTLVAASHDRELLRRMDGILEIRAERAHFFPGGFDFYEEERRSAIERADAEKIAASREAKRARQDRQTALARQAERERTAERRAPDAGIPRVALGLLKRNAERTRGKLSRKSAERIQEADRRSEAARKKAHRRQTWAVKPGESPDDGRLVVSVQGLRARIGAREIWPQALKFSIHAGERVRLAGSNGSGKSTLCAILLGNPDEAVSIRGTVCVKSRIAYLNQHGEALICNPGQSMERHTPRFGGRTEMSGGERMHSAIRWILESGAELVALDEPTNHLDLERIGALTEALNQYRGALLLISHDEDFVREVGCAAEIRLDWSARER